MTTFFIHSVGQKVFNVNMETCFLKFGREPGLDFADMCLEWNVNETVDIGRQFDIPFVQNSDVLSAQS